MRDGLNSVGFSDVTTERSISDTEYGSLGEAMPKKTKPTSGIRKHNHYRVTVTYTNNQVSGRVYNNREKAEKFAAGQKKSPVAKTKAARDAVYLFLFRLPRKECTPAGAYSARLSTFHQRFARRDRAKRHVQG
jgi:hypothetical protein